MSYFRGGWEVKKNRTRGIGSLVKIGHPIFWYSCWVFTKKIEKKRFSFRNALPILFCNQILITLFQIHIISLTKIEKSGKFWKPPLKQGGLWVKIGHHKIGACAEIGQNWIRGGWGWKKHIERRTSFMYVPLYNIQLPRRKDICITCYHCAWGT